MQMVTRFRKWEAETLRAAVQSTRSSACSSIPPDNNGSAPPSPLPSATSTFAFNVIAGSDRHGIAVHHPPSPLYRGTPPPMQVPPLNTLGTTRSAHSLSTLCAPANPLNLQTSRHFRTVRPRQLIIAVTANGAECGECGDNGFDEICLKPLAKHGLYQIINRYFS